MSPDRARRREREYRVSLSAGFLVAAAVHLLLFALGSFIILPLHVRAEQPPLLGYRGRPNPLLELEIMEPNSIQAFFYQRRREGMRAAPEYHVLDEPKIQPGPNPILVRQNEKPKPEEKPQVTDYVESPHVPAPPLHTLLSFSEDFVILKAVKPDYPESERSRGIEGYVLLACYVTPAGDSIDEQVMESGTVPAGGSAQAFEQAALEAVRKWKVLPPRRDGEPQGAWLPIRVKFDLSDLEPE